MIPRCSFGREVWLMNILHVFDRRPETSFLWFTSPWKTFKHIVWKRYKWYFIGGIIALLFIVFIVLFIYSVPVRIYVLLKLIIYYLALQNEIPIQLLLLWVISKHLQCHLTLIFVKSGLLVQVFIKIGAMPYRFDIPLEPVG